MARGDYLCATSPFAAICREHREDRLEAPAYFAWGIAHYRAGDLQSAADHFMVFQYSYGEDAELHDLLGIAKFDLAVTEIQLMQDPTASNERFARAQSAAKALISFLDSWPDSVLAPSARSLLLEVQQFLRNPS